MSYCPKCRAEFREGITTCSECNCDLVEELEQIDTGIKPQYEEAFLLSAANSIEADMIEALLNSNDIPVLKRYKESGGYMKIYMGETIFGVDLYVPRPILEKAREIVEESRGASLDEAFLENAMVEDELQEDLVNDDDAQKDGGQEEIENDENYKIDEKSGKSEGELLAQEEKINRKRRISSWIILLIFVPGILWIIIMLLINLFD